MSMQVTVVGKDSDENIELKREAYKACIRAGVDVPDELFELFNDDADSSGREVELPFRLVKAEGRTQYVVDVESIPDNVKQVVFSILY